MSAWHWKPRPTLKRRRRFSTSRFIRAQVVLEVLPTQTSQSDLARQHKLEPELTAQMKNHPLEGLAT